MHIGLDVPVTDKTDERFYSSSTLQDTVAACLRAPWQAEERIPSLLHRSIYSDPIKTTWPTL